MPNNEKQALQQIIYYFQKKEYDKLKFYFNIVDSKYFLDLNNQKILNGLKFLLLEKQTLNPFDKIKSKEAICKELLQYLQSNYPQENFTEESILFLKDEFSNENNLDFLDNLKHTYTQEKLFQQLIQIIRPSFEPQNDYDKHLYYQATFEKIRKFISFIPNKNDKTLFNMAQMITFHPELFEINNEAKQKIQEEYYRLSATFKGINQATKGFKKGQVITIGGYTGLGKTTFVYNLLLDITKQKFQEKQHHPYMLVFSYEMTLAENLSRLLSNQTKIPLDTVYDKEFVEITSEEYIKITTEAKDFFSQINLSFSYDQSKNIDYVMDLVYRLHLEQKAEIIVIDHLQITKTTTHTENDRLAIDQIMAKLKKLAIELNIVVIILSQFSRETYSSYKGTTPAITALKGSGGIETNSDIVLIMSEFNSKINKEREKPFILYNEVTEQLYNNSKIHDNQKIIELSIKKNRSGTKKNLIYHFEMTTQTFQEIGYVLPYQIEIH